MGGGAVEGLVLMPLQAAEGKGLSDYLVVGGAGGWMGGKGSCEGDGGLRGVLVAGG